eukprot:scaffold9336_cov133-Isochrysis_galbana.AAC.3
MVYGRYAVHRISSALPICTRSRVVSKEWRRSVPRRFSAHNQHHVGGHRCRSFGGDYDPVSVAA